MTYPVGPEARWGGLLSSTPAHSNQSRTFAKVTLVEWQPVLPVPDGGAEIALYLLGVDATHVGDVVALYAKSPSDMLFGCLLEAYKKDVVFYTMFAGSDRYAPGGKAIATHLVGARLWHPRQAFGEVPDLAPHVGGLTLALKATRGDTIAYTGAFNYAKE